MKAALMHDPAEYEAWYHTSRGAWIGNTEFSLMRPAAGARLLGVGCGTGWFSRRFSECGLQVTAVDPDPTAIAYARSQGGEKLPPRPCRLQITALTTAQPSPVYVLSMMYSRPCRRCGASAVMALYLASF